jgi:hypothetical protein
MRDARRPCRSAYIPSLVFSPTARRSDFDDTWALFLILSRPDVYDVKVRGINDASCSQGVASLECPMREAGA